MELSKKITIGIFAHPDDEAFGCAGTFLAETENGTELHLITLTLGDSGENPDNHPNLVALREQEWRRSGELMGATSMHFLGYHDGQLNNQSMIDAGSKIVTRVTEILQHSPDADDIEFVTIDLNGVTGHIDHIVAARAASWAYYTLKARGINLRRIRYACLSRDEISEANIDWLYMEPGHPSDEIDQTIDARQYHDKIVTIIRAHHSQRSDGEALIARQGDKLGLNYFIVRE